MPNEITIEGDRILVAFDYDPENVFRVKQILNRHGGTRGCWQPDRRVWSCPVEAARDLGATFPALKWAPAFKELAGDAKFAEAPVTTSFVDSLGDLSQPLPDGRILYEHQQTGIKWLCDRQFAILADDMGLGKTVQSLVAAKAMHEATGAHTVIITKATQITDWREEAEKVGHRVVSVHSWAKLPVHSGNRIVVILDEAHYMQTFKSKRTQAALELCSKADAVFALTGTPMPNGRPENLYPLLRAIRHPLAGKKSFFDQRFCNATLKRIKFKDKNRKPIQFWDTSGASNLEDLHRQTKPFILQRLKTQCLDMPPKTRVHRDLEIDKDMQAIYDRVFRAAKDKWEQRVARKEIIEDSEAIVELGAIRKAASMAKVQPAIELIEEALGAGGQVIAFTTFVEPITTLAKHFNVPAFYGEQDPAVKERMKTDFRDGKLKLFASTIEAGGTGLNLQAANTVFLIDRDMVPGKNAQAEDRAYRIGQKWPVTAYWLRAFKVCRTIDELVEKKTKAINTVMTGKEDGGAEGHRITARDVLGELFKDWEP